MATILKNKFIQILSSLKSELSFVLQSPVKTKAQEYIEAYILEEFYKPEVGQAYSISKEAKDNLIEKFKTISRKVPTATSWLYYVILATTIFQISKKTKGDIIECGCWKGGGSAILSLICNQVGRKLIIADSFEGIPEDTDKKGHFYTHLNILGFYQKGMYEGTLEEVKKNINEFGKLETCRFIKGFYAQSLKKFKFPLVLAFLDVDLKSSLEDSMQYIWPLLTDGAYIYTDDSCDMDVVKFWFDDSWWHENLKIKSPGYVGSGCGLPVNPEYSSIGYTRKIVHPEKYYQRKNWFSAYHEPNEK